MRYVDRRGNVLGASQLVGLGLAHRAGLVERGVLYGLGALAGSDTVPATVRRGAKGIHALQTQLNYLAELAAGEATQSSTGNIKQCPSGGLSTEWPCMLETPVDGDFGSKTETAVKSFQQSKGLKPDGVVGPNTWKALFGPSGPFPSGGSGSSGGGGTIKPAPPAYTPPKPAPPSYTPPGPAPAPPGLESGGAGAGPGASEDEWPMWKIGLAAGGAFVGLMALGLLLTSPKKKGSSAAALPAPAATPALAAPAAARANRRRRRRR